MTISPGGFPPELSVDGSTATITLRRPDLANRLELADLDLTRGFIQKVNEMHDVLVLRLRAEGRHFCAGFNIGSVGESGAGARFEALANELEEARPVTIAAINGGIYGGATDLALACDFRIGSPTCRMFVPAARLGLLFYRSALERFVTRLGLNTAKRLLLTGAALDAKEMLDCGFLDHLMAPTQQLDQHVDELSSSLSGMAPLALLGMKKHLNRIARGTLDQGDIECDIARADASEDLREGALAWQQKRRPVFRGT